jgi:effector-binding domain-containing protein
MKAMIDSPRLLDVAPIPTAVIRDRVPQRELSRFVPAACGEVWNFLKAAGIKGGRHMALYGDPQGMVEVGAEVPEPFEGTERVQCSRLPGGKVVTVTHYGPYGGLGAAHGAIHAWLEEQGLEPGISWEIYGHWEESWNADASKIRTDVFYLLEAT